MSTTKNKGSDKKKPEFDPKTMELILPAAGGTDQEFEMTVTKENIVVVKTTVKVKSNGHHEKIALTDIEETGAYQPGTHVISLRKKSVKGAGRGHSNIRFRLNRQQADAANFKLIQKLHERLKDTLEKVSKKQVKSDGVLSGHLDELSKRYDEMKKFMEGSNAMSNGLGEMQEKNLEMCGEFMKELERQKSLTDNLRNDVGATESIGTRLEAMIAQLQTGIADLQSKISRIQNAVPPVIGPSWRTRLKDAFAKTRSKASGIKTSTLAALRSNRPVTLREIIVGLFVLIIVAVILLESVLAGAFVLPRLGSYLTDKLQYHDTMPALPPVFPGTDVQPGEPPAPQDEAAPMEPALPAAPLIKTNFVTVTVTQDVERIVPPVVPPVHEYSRSMWFPPLGHENDGIWYYKIHPGEVMTYYYRPGFPGPTSYFPLSEMYGTYTPKWFDCYKCWVMTMTVRLRPNIDKDEWIIFDIKRRPGQ